MATQVLSSSVGRGRKRKRQVSWAAAELLEEVKLFHMAKPVNPSIPPPAVDDAGEDDPSSQPGLALLGLLGVESSSSSSPSSSSTLSSSSPAAAAALTSTSSTSSAFASNGKTSSSGGAAAAAAAGGGSAANNGGGLFRTSASAPRAGDSQLGGGSGGDGGVGAESASGPGRTAGGNRLFKGFEKTETVVRRRKQVSPPPPPAGTPPPLPPTDGGAHPAHRYPKDIWPGHKPPNHAADSGQAGKQGGASGEAEEQLEFFCDGCDETIPNGVERMECAVCPDEFCLCHGCYDEGEVLDKRHKHELLPSSAPFHVTRAAPSAEAALQAAKALHVTEAENEGSSHYDDDDLG